MSLMADMALAAADLFSEAGEMATYISTSLAPYQVNAIFRGLNADDMVSEHVRADCVVCEIREAELKEAPVRGDIIEREQPFGMQTLEVVDRNRDESGVWRLFCQQNIRVVP